MNVDTCAHGMPSPASCVDCMDDDGLGAAPVPPLHVVVGLTARFPGRCMGCDDDIHPDEALVKLSDDTYRHAHPDCLGGVL